MTHAQSRLVFCALLCAALLPVFAHADTAADVKSTNDLHAAIQSSVLADPRSASLSPSQLGSLVAALTDAAQQRGLSAQDVLYHPGQKVITPQSASAPVSLCDGIICSMSDAFGFSGASGILLFLTVLLSGLLILIIGNKIHRTHEVLSGL
jgi:hypothetical protein